MPAWHRSPHLEACKRRACSEVWASLQLLHLRLVTEAVAHLRAGLLACCLVWPVDGIDQCRKIAPLQFQNRLPPIKRKRRAILFPGLQSMFNQYQVEYLGFARRALCTGTCTAPPSSALPPPLQVALWPGATRCRACQALINLPGSDLLGRRNSLEG